MLAFAFGLRLHSKPRVLGGRVPNGKAQKRLHVVYFALIPLSMFFSQNSVGSPKKTQFLCFFALFCAFFGPKKALFPCFRIFYPRFFSSIFFEPPDALCTTKRKKCPLLWGRGNLGGILGDNLGEGNCESKIAARQWGVNFCCEASRCLAGPSG